MPPTKQDHTKVVVPNIPRCDLPHGEETILAYADARLRSGAAMGSWAYVCRGHFVEYGCELGLGKGQELITRHPDADPSWRPGRAPSEANGWACQHCGKPGGH
jgi:hypothetical protein